MVLLPLLRRRTGAKDAPLWVAFPLGETERAELRARYDADLERIARAHPGALMTFAPGEAAA